MSRQNLGWAFYRDYYQREAESVFGWERNAHPRPSEKDSNAFFKEKNQQFLDATLAPSPTNEIAVGGTTGFTLTTTYPGLLSGSGVSHGSGLKGEHKLGFQFDHTTGQPVLPGSSVKGRLRSVFPNRLRRQEAEKIEKNDRLSAKLQAKATQKETYLLSLIATWCRLTLTKQQLHELEWAIFEGVNLQFSPDKPNYDHSPRLAVYDCDVFWDAYISKGNEKGCFLGNDFITPHKHKTRPELDPFVNPVPVQFLKVLPEVSWTFQFSLKDSHLSGGLIVTASQKQTLFEAILLDWGIGAKTNVGYGQFDDTRKRFFAETENAKYQLIEGDYYFVGTVSTGVLVQAVASSPNKAFPKQKLFKLLIGQPGQEVAVPLSYSDPAVDGKPCFVSIAGLSKKTKKIETIEFKGFL